MPAFSIACARSASSAAPPSPSPSSFWIWRICSRSTYSRWRSSIVALVLVSISRESLSTSMRCESSSSTRSTRADASTISSTDCFSTGFRSMKPAIMSASWPAEVKLCTDCTSSGGVCGRSWSASTARSRSWWSRASISAPLLLAGRQALDARDQERIALEQLEHAEPPFALRDDVMGAIGRRDVAHDLRRRADVVEVFALGRLDVGLALQDES